LHPFVIVADLSMHPVEMSWTIKTFACLGHKTIRRNFSQKRLTISIVRALHV